MSEPTPEPTKEEVEEALEDEPRANPEYGELYRKWGVLASAVRGMREVRPAAKKCVSCLHLYQMDGRPIPARCKRPIEHRGVVSPCDGEIVVLTRRPRWAEGE